MLNCRALDAVPERREERRAVQLRGRTSWSSTEIRLPNHLGIAGAVFTSGKSINIPLRLRRPALQSRRSTRRPATSRARSCACRSSTRTARTIGVTQVLNKRGGPFTAEDESAAAGVHRADRDRARERQAVRRRPEHEELQRRHAGEHVERRHHARRGGTRSCTCNAAGLRILRRDEEQLVRQAAGEDFFAGATPGCWIERIDQVDARRGTPDLADGRRARGRRRDRLDQPHRAAADRVERRSASAR